MPGGTMLLVCTVTACLLPLLGVQPHAASEAGSLAQHSSEDKLLPLKVSPFLHKL